MDTLALSNFLKQNGVPDATTDKLIGMLQISSHTNIPICRGQQQQQQQRSA